MADELLPMDGIEENAPQSSPAPTDTPPSPPADTTNRDESGRFAPKGQPNSEAARRREAQERDEWRGRFEARDKEYAALKTRLDDMGKFLAGDKQETKPDPLAELNGKLDKLTGSFEQQQQEREEAAAWQNIRSYSDEHEARFTAATPDFPDAVQHYIHSRLGEMKAIGLNQEQAEQSLQQEAQTLLMRCAQQNLSPAEVLYGMAQARGYAAGARPALQAGGRPPVPSGGRSLGTGAGAGNAGLSAQQIANMDEADYNAFRNTPEGQRQIRRAMGG